MADEDYTIQREDGPTRGRYVIRLAPGYEAEMTFRKAGDGTITIDHTGVQPEYEGRGIAERLVKRAISDAREEFDSRVKDARSVIRERKKDVNDAVRSGKAAARDARTAFERRLSEARASRGEPEASGD